MPKWIQIGPASILDDGAMQEVRVAGQALLLARVDGVYYATQARCPHLRAHLVKGQIAGKVVTCPAHGSTFDVTTGRNLTWVEGLPGVLRPAAQALSAPRDLATYPVKVEEGQVWVDLEAG